MTLLICPFETLEDHLPSIVSIGELLNYYKNYSNEEISDKNPGYYYLKDNVDVPFMVNY